MQYSSTERLMKSNFQTKILHCKKRLAVFPSPAGMSLTKLSLARNNRIIPLQGEFGGLVTSRLGTGKRITFFVLYGTVLYKRSFLSQFIGSLVGFGQITIIPAVT